MSNTIQVLIAAAAGALIGYVLCRKNNAPVPDEDDQSRLKFVLSFPNQIKIQGETLMARINDSQKVGIELKPVGKKGNPAEVQAGSVKWESSDESVATVTPDADNQLKATVTAVGLGATQITATADADLGEGLREITGSGAIEVVGSEAQSFELSFGEPSDVTATGDSTGTGEEPAGEEA